MTTTTPVTLTEGQRFRTSGTTFEVLQNTDVAASLIEVTPQATKLLKVACAKCGYTVRVTERWLKHGFPICPTDSIFMERAEARTPKAAEAKPKAEPKPKSKPAPKPEPPKAPASKLSQLLDRV